jgi:hypothetical protein
MIGGFEFRLGHRILCATMGTDKSMFNQSQRKFNPGSQKMRGGYIPGLLAPNTCNFHRYSFPVSTRM